MPSTNRVAVALGLANTAATLDALNQLGNSVGFAEIRLDLMEEFDLESIVASAPCPLIITCRAQREGGNFAGSETERLDILTRASELNCSYVDIEWDSVRQFDNKSESTQVIASRHYYSTMPHDLWKQYAHLSDQADVVKLVGFAERVSEAIEMLELIVKANKPLIAIAMGPAGALTRLLAPCFEACLLTYGAINRESVTAPGQLSVEEMIDRFAIDRVSTETRIDVYLYTNPDDGSNALQNSGGNGSWLGIPVLVDPEEVEVVTAALRNLSPRISATLCQST